MIKTISFLNGNIPFEYDIGIHRGDRIRFELDVYQEQAKNSKPVYDLNINIKG